MFKQETLFESFSDKKIFDYKSSGCLEYFPSFFGQKESNNFMDVLLNNIPWRQDQINIMGGLIDIPRLTAWYGIDDKSYTYSGIKMNPYPMTDEIVFIKTKIEKTTKSNYTSVLLNQYRDGNDSVDWHSDDEKEIDEKFDIASVSFGMERDFQFKPKSGNNIKLKNLLLENGSLIIMKPPFQQHFIHRLPKRKKVTSPRINLTFRVIK